MHDELTVLYLDFAKAFDTVPDELLLRKTQPFGIGGSLLKLFASYISNRVQFVKIDDNLLTVKNVTSWVPPLVAFRTITHPLVMVHTVIPVRQ